MRISGIARCGRRTKDLAKRLRRGEIAVIDHVDLDSVGAQMLIDAQVYAVINLSPSISGRYPNRGPSILLHAGIPLLDVYDPSLMDSIPDGARIELNDNMLVIDNEVVGEGELQTAEVIAEKLENSRQNLDCELKRFAQNTLDYAAHEMGELLSPIEPPVVKVKIRDRHAMVVVRGEGYKNDLQIIKGYLTGERPVLIAVDGGADALLEMGLKPHIILGDMDSVSDEALKSGAEIVVHTYADGRVSPGIERIRKLGLAYQEFAVSGTSEDAAMILAYEHGASLIVAVGTHSNLYDFLDKGRKGMASTMLVRMRIGSKLVDAKGVSKLYGVRAHSRYLWLLLFAGLLLFGVIMAQSAFVQSWFGVKGNWLRLWMLNWGLSGN